MLYINKGFNNVSDNKVDILGLVIILHRIVRTLTDTHPSQLLNKRNNVEINAEIPSFIN